MNIPILTYHSLNMSANTYAENDHLALQSDLRALDEGGWKVISLEQLVDWHQHRAALPHDRCVAITFDDGSDFDYQDLEHHELGMQASMFRLLQEFQQTQPDVHATSFVIVSPRAREQLDKNALIGRGWWNEDWWLASHRSGLMAIESHGWDHVHPLIDEVAQRDQVRSDFTAVNTLEDCRAQVEQSQDYLQQKLDGYRPRFFAYPWGQVSDYMAEEYLPRHVASHGLKAAFTSRARPVTHADGIWRLPRFVCGRDWRSPEELNSILAACSTR